MNEMNYAVYKRFNKYLNESGVKLYELSRRADTSVSVLSSMKTGYIPSTRQLIGVCSAAGLSADYLLGLRDDNAPVRRNVAIHKLYKMVSENMKKLVAENSGSPTLESEKCGISSGLIANYIERKHLPTTEIALKITNHYNVSLDWLLGLSEEERE